MSFSKVTSSIFALVRPHFALLVLFLFLVSPSVMFYLTNSTLTFFLPVFMAAQISILLLAACLLKKRWIIYSVNAIFIIASLVNWAHFFLFKYELTEGAAAAILSTNLHETSELLSILPYTFWICTFIICALFIALYRFTPEIYLPGKKTALLFSGIFLFSIGLKSLSQKSLIGGASEVISKSQPIKTFVTLYSGKKLLDDLRKQLASIKRLSLKTQVSTIQKHQTHIIVIGESARRKNWSMYGYPRDTNKYTKKFSDLVLFKNAISAANATIQSISHTLTYSEGDAFSSILAEADAAGFKTFWISNQARFGVFDNATTVLAEHAHETKFINTDTSSASFDDSLIKELNRYLKDETQKKLIIIHLMGSHFYYNRRYPEKFNVYKDSKILNQAQYKTQNHNTVNEYDNTILYTDYVLSQILDSIQKQNTLSSVLYFSDHGEYLFDHEDSYGHGGVKVKKTEVEIPMFFWASESFKKENDTIFKLWKSSAEKEVSLYDLFPTYLYSLGINVATKDKINFLLSDVSKRERFIFNSEQKKIFYKDLK